MNEISCDVCLDLIPLVKDGIASADSQRLVREHLSGCESCSAVFGDSAEEAACMDDAAVMGRIKRQITLVLACIMLAGALLGMLISDGSNLFYNALIMPGIGGIGDVLLGRRAYLVPGFLFFFSFLWVSIRELAGGILQYGAPLDLILMSLWWAAIFTFFCTVGILISRLLRYALRKEGNRE